MHRATPLNSSFRAYTGGGTRSAVDTITDTTLMQEMAGNFMQGEARKAIESPQNYGFTSVVMPAIKDELGNITDSAEAVISFMGGNRSFPVAGVMDDRRHRMINMQPGDTGMFSTVGRMLQIHLNTDGGFFTGTRDKTVRLQLLDQDSKPDQQQQQSGQSGQQQAGKKRDWLHVQATNGSSGGSSSSSGQSGQQQKGQQPQYKNAQNSYRFVDVQGAQSRVSGQNVHLMLQDGNVYVHVADDMQVYLGGKKGSGFFSKVLTVDGPAKNVWALVE